MLESSTKAKEKEIPRGKIRKGNIRETQKLNKKRKKERRVKHEKL
jgi:hypothetical protein